jgi:hypothetical protein
MDFDDLIVERAPTPGAPADQPDRHFYEGAVMLAYAMHLLRTEPVSEVRIHRTGSTLARSTSRAGSRSAASAAWPPREARSPAPSKTPKAAGS